MGGFQLRILWDCISFSCDTVMKFKEATEKYQWILKYDKQYFLSVALIDLFHKFQAEFCDRMTVLCRNFGNVMWGMDIDGNFKANTGRSMLQAFVTTLILDTISTFALRPEKPRKYWFNWPVPGLLLRLKKV
jgi:hypothetical protein